MVEEFFCPVAINASALSTGEGLCVGSLLTLAGAEGPYAKGGAEYEGGRFRCTWRTKRGRAEVAWCPPRQWLPATRPAGMLAQWASLIALQA
jgi:hypothetical protein